MPDTDYLVVGRVRRAHGIRGELAVEALTTNPDDVFAAGARVFAGTVTGELARDRQELHVVYATPFKDGYIVKFEEINDRTSSELWRERYFLLPSAELSPPGDDELYVHDIPGMTVVTADGARVGEVLEVYELPQGLVLDVKREDGTVMIPFSEPTVVEVDREARVIRVDPLEGLLD
jgi:16S rRNA processing protein RimM